MSLVIDRLTDDVSQWKPRVLPELVFWPDRAPGEIQYRIEVPSRHKFFSVGYEEYVFISLLDGKTTVAQACGRAAQTLGREALTQRQADSITQWLLQQELATLDGVKVRSAAVPAQPNTPAKQGLWERFNPFWIKLPLPIVDHLIRSSAGLLAPIFSPLAIAAACLIMLVGIVSVAMQWDRFIASSAAIFSPSTWVATLVTWIVLKFLHELAHAAAARRYGCETTQVGIVLVLLAPLAYVDVTTSWRLRSRWQRIAIAAAGMYLELTIAAIAAIAWCWVDSPVFTFHLYNVILAASLSTLLFNANPLMRFDGYYILTDLLQLPNLAGEGSMAIRDLASRLFYARGIARERHYGWRRAAVVGYGIASIAWRILICISLVIAAGFMFRGAGVVLVGFAMLAWVIRPIARTLQSLNRQRQRAPAACVRAVVVAASLAVIAIAGVFYMPVSTAIVAPAVVDQGEDVAVRTATDGFVETIDVVDGETVRTGDVLIRLRNEELHHQLVKLQTEIGQAEIRKRSAAEKQDVAAVQIEREALQALGDRMQQLQNQIDGLTVTAHRDGTIVARGLADRLQQYVPEGTELLTIALPSDRRVIASIAQQDIRQVAMQVGKPVQIKTASRDRAAGRLAHIHPLATSELQHVALAGIHDGPLPVRADSEAGTYRLLSPRFEAIIDIDAGEIDRLPVGQTVRVQIGRMSLTPYQRVRVWFQRLLEMERTAARDRS
ncbi:efflux RND transporter periplasmic adaptor subunit [Rosistilla oblonga]|uniref:Peptidase family M50 n=1 Tax=Rosistilla oblonga TaxID=2527990 RepID=A0A518IVQ0_9BACT|nr:efflux RND transporter periplasmic adaptor subunit [Rosistilla oblonga]QDV57166.1 Peptidase family M50 [Rosistilla oblonga]